VNCIWIIVDRMMREFNVGANVSNRWLPQGNDPQEATPGKTSFGDWRAADGHVRITVCSSKSGPALVLKCYRGRRHSRIHRQICWVSAKREQRCSWYMK
jgi:hypothetical protein